MIISLHADKLGLSIRGSEISDNKWMIVQCRHGTITAQM